MSVQATRNARILSNVKPSLSIPKWRRNPIFKSAFCFKLQDGSYYVCFYCLVMCFLQFALATFDLYCLFEATPGSRHFRASGIAINFLSVYSGNVYIRWGLITSALFLLLLSLYLLTMSIILLLNGLPNESEPKLGHWLCTMALFTVVRLVLLLFQSIVNDLYFGYHQGMLILWLFLILLNVFAWLVVFSNYQELRYFRKLENMLKEKVEKMKFLKT